MPLGAATTSFFGSTPPVRSLHSSACKKLITSEVRRIEMREGKLPRRQYTQEFKAEAVRLAASVGGHEAARRLGVPVATLGNWSRRGIASAGASGAVAPASEPPTRRPVSELEAENSRLRRELADAKLDVEVLRKATAYFARGSR